MHSGIMLQLSVSSGQPIHTQLKWLVLSSIVPPLVSEIDFMQGELAHRLVKRLYGLTNKKDAPEQIARHYRRGHHFDGPGSHGPSQPDERESRQHSDGDSAEFHHTITTSRNNRLELASFSSNNPQDPATKVRPHTPLRLSSSHLASRILSTSFVSISSVDSLAEVSMAMTPASSQMKNETRSGSSTMPSF